MKAARPVQTARLGTRQGALVTVAFLKAQLDEGSDHLGIFAPLVADTVASIAGSFTASEVQEALADRHGLAMPQETVATLLQRALSKKLLIREVGRYRRNPSKPLPHSDLQGMKARIEAGQRQLGQELRDYARKYALPIKNETEALNLLLQFLEHEQVGMLVDGDPGPTATDGPKAKELAVVARFICDRVHPDPILAQILRQVLEGLVLFHAAFLPDLAIVNRHFKDLRVILDSNLVRQALGYEGRVLQALMRETIDLLKGNGVQCIVLDKTVQEIKRILAVYEEHVGTSHGQRTLRPGPMARHFLTQRYSQSDVREMSALLEYEIRDLGLTIMQAPSRSAQHTTDEKALAARFADPTSKDDQEPRVVHDVDCVAAVITLRQGRRSTSLDDAKVVFATSSPLVIKNSRLWWEEDEHEHGVPPVVHIRALTNVAWLKKPRLASDLKLQELVALCAAALRPSRATWRRFLNHLDSLRNSQRISSDEMAAVLVSAMSDRLLKDAELERSEGSDVDAASLDEVVQRVTRSYAAKSEERLREVSVEYEAKLAAAETSKREAIARAEKVEQDLAETLRRHTLALEGRAQRWARWLSAGFQWLLAGLVVGGAICLLVSHPFHSTALGIVAFVCVVTFLVLELTGILRHVREMRAEVEVRLTRVFRRWLATSNQGQGGPD